MTDEELRQRLRDACSDDSASNIDVDEHAERVANVVERVRKGLGLPVELGELLLERAKRGLRR